MPRELYGRLAGFSAERRQTHGCPSTNCLSMCAQGNVQQPRRCLCYNWRGVWGGSMHRPSPAILGAQYMAMCRGAPRCPAAPIIYYYYYIAGNMNIYIKSNRESGFTTFGRPSQHTKSEQEVLLSSHNSVWWGITPYIELRVECR